MIQCNYPVNEAKLLGLSVRKCATIQQGLILKFAFGPEKLRVFRETGPRVGKSEGKKRR